MGRKNKGVAAPSNKLTGGGLAPAKPARNYNPDTDTLSFKEASRVTHRDRADAFGALSDEDDNAYARARGGAAGAGDDSDAADSDWEQHRERHAARDMEVLAPWRRKGHGSDDDGVDAVADEDADDGVDLKALEEEDRQLAKEVAELEALQREFGKAKRRGAADSDSDSDADSDAADSDDSDDAVEDDDALVLNADGRKADRRAWGATRNVFYQVGDDRASDDDDAEEAAKEELKEARRVQQAQLADMAEDDFLGDLAGVAEPSSAAAAGSADGAAGAANLLAQDHLDLSVFVQPADALAGGFDDILGDIPPAVAPVASAASTKPSKKAAKKAALASASGATPGETKPLTLADQLATPITKAQLTLVKRDAPEILELLDEFHVRSEERHLMHRLVVASYNVCASAMEDPLESAALIYLRLKYDLLTQFLIYALAYLALRATTAHGTAAVASLADKTARCDAHIATLRQQIRQIETKVEGTTEGDNTKPLVPVIIDLLEEFGDAPVAEIVASFSAARPTAVAAAQAEAMVAEAAEHPTSKQQQQRLLAQVKHTAAVAKKLAEAKSDEEDASDVNSEAGEDSASAASDSNQSDASMSDSDTEMADDSMAHAADLLGLSDLPTYADAKYESRLAAEMAKRSSASGARSAVAQELREEMEQQRQSRRNAAFHLTRLSQQPSAPSASDRKRSLHGDMDLPLRDKFGKVVLTPEEAEQEKSASRAARATKQAALEAGSAGGDDVFRPLPAAETPSASTSIASKKRKSGAGKLEDEHAFLTKAGAALTPDEQYYLDVLEQTKKTKTAKEAAKKERKQGRRADRAAHATMGVTDHKHADGDDGEVGEDGAPRAANWRMVTNKALHILQSKRKGAEKRNPRVARRKKFEKKLKRLGSTKRLVKDPASLGAYQGETTGIRRDFTASTRF